MRTIRKLIYRLARLWWAIRKPITVGVRVLLIRDGKVLLVRHSYQDAWYLPGGGVKGGESLETTIRREAAEEVGAMLGELTLFGAYSNFYEGKSDHIALFLCRRFELSGKTDGEIERFGFFPPDALPAGTSPGTQRRIQDYVQNDIPYVGIW
ncbi:MAG: NUDIX domain-containing protein [Anaerolineae bacterium]|nr:NUDIX domain-containing protein [Anaerolineae bacterium]